MDQTTDAMNYALLLKKCRLTVISIISNSSACLLCTFAENSESTAKLCLQLFQSVGVKDVSMQDIRSQTLEINNQISYTALISNGVPQGSVISALLFLLYINDIHTCCDIYLTSISLLMILTYCMRTGI